MNKLILYSTVFFWMISCATSEPRYRDSFDLNKVVQTDNIETTFYLIGDAGYAKKGKSTSALLALEKYLATNPQQDNYTIFLGDNIYPDGMPKEDAPDRAIAEHRLDVQIDAVRDFEGKVYYIPGNHDWYNEGLQGLEREEKYFEKKLDDNKAFRPSKGCALESIEVSENIQLMILDSQWFLTDWDKHPTINDNCSEIKTREALFLEIEGEFKKNKNKTILFTLHHPLYTNGVHGGKFAPVKHLYPSQKKIPVPGLASLATLIRTSGGVSSQDNMNKQYKTLVHRLETLAKGAGRIIFASGHEHSLQYIEHEGIKQIVSGSGAKSSYVALRNDGLFAYAGQGFARLDILKDGSSYVSYYSSNENTAQLVFKTKIYNAPKAFDITSLPPLQDVKFKKASIYEEAGTDRTDFYESIWGDHYRDLYGKKIQANVAILDTLYGGLKVVREGGGHQTKSIRLKDKNDREYNMRALKKNGVQFLQSVVFKENYVEKSLENTISEDILKDFYTAAHPYAFMAIPHLADAVGVFHTNPELYYVPKQPVLGKFNSNFGDELYMIEERPEENFKDLASFGKPDDIESTSDLFEKLREDEKYKLDEPSYVRARLFDMLIGDWDRHQDQWRWAEFEEENGDHIFRPIPRDRDQAFSNFDGAFLGALRGTLGFSNQFQVYGPTLDNVKWINISAIQLDRTLLNNTQRKTWQEQAEYIKEHLTDTAIDKAFALLPEEAKGTDLEYVVASLKGRRAILVDIAHKYHQFLASLAVVTGTDKDDYIHIERMDKGKTKITISRIKDGEKADVVSEKFYDKKDTKEIWVYGLDDDDTFEVSGKGSKRIAIRIIGGQNNDTYHIKNGKKVTVYDYKSKPNTVVKKSGARFRFTDDYQTNHFNKDQKRVNSNALLPTIGFNPDDGILFGLSNITTINGFHRNPFTAQHIVRAGYYIATSSFDLQYTGAFSGVLGDYNLIVEGFFTNPSFATNFFGFGNETLNRQEELDFDYNRVRLSRYGLSLGAAKSGRFGSYFGYKLRLDGIDVAATEGRFITAESSLDSDHRVFDRLWFTGLDATYRYESYDVDVNPTRGMKFELNGGVQTNIADIDRTYGYVKTYLGFYNAISRNRKLVLKTIAATHNNIGRSYEFYQAATIGGSSQFFGNGLMRGYRAQRFSGQSAFASSADLRYSFNQFKTRVLPIQIGLFAGGDMGRVWLDGTVDANRWHSDIGGGLWINSTDTIKGTFQTFFGEDGARFSFAFSFKF